MSMAEPTIFHELPFWISVFKNHSLTEDKCRTAALIVKGIMMMAVMLHFMMIPMEMVKLTAIP